MCICLITTACNSFFFYPEKRLYITPERLKLAYEDVYLETQDKVRLHGWHLPAREPNKGTVLFFHGNAQNISTHIASVFWLPDAGYEVFLFDYRGYGLSGGEPDIATLIHDATLQIDYLVNERRVDRRKLVIFGQSLGGAIAINAVSKTQTDGGVRALIFDSTFSSFRRIAREKLDLLWLTWPFQWPLSYAFDDTYNPTVALKNIQNVAILVIHSDADTIIPIGHGETLYATAHPPKQFWRLEGKSHITSMSDPKIRERLKDYLDQLMTE